MFLDVFTYMEIFVITFRIHKVDKGKSHGSKVHRNRSEKRPTDQVVQLGEYHQAELLEKYTLLFHTPLKYRP